MTDKKPHIVILGAGPAGVGAAYQLTKQNKARVTVLELNDGVGGNSGSFQEEGMYLDFGSHRLHPACHPEILEDIREVLGDDLCIRPRHGRIRLNNRWIHFPLKASELMTQLSLSFSFGVFSDMVRSFFTGSSKQNGNDETFATVLKNKLGKTICNEFYFPYAKKIWGLSPDEISVVQAEKRVSANSFGKLIKKVFSKPKNANQDGAPVFYYPKKGFGQITEALYEKAEENGATFLFNARVKNLVTENGTAKSVIFEEKNVEKEIKADYIWSTLPITLMAYGLKPEADKTIMEAAKRMKFRSMVLIYLFIEKNRFTEFDAHYFPEIDIPITRLSEIKNYSDTYEPENLTCICAELPCNFEDEIWATSDEMLGELVQKSLQKANIPVDSPVKKVLVKRLKHAYPIYNTGFEKNYDILDNHLKTVDRLLAFGRQGLFVHDNTHHALYMAYSAVDCINGDGSFNHEKWKNYRKEFESHVVVD
ncbi:FAD-dependent oxidoreductase [Rhodohalobacter sp. 614A]|uniref:FAD-dependent oxidoreductase n=1 Tax=Rhodohalobacter sp. 614A TaxID=2908649 RepID=UPI001F2B1729|nr:FAD-dependent oxidoreductase [Rhodohalobacter sp. 614A]